MQGTWCLHHLCPHDWDREAHNHTEIRFIDYHILILFRLLTDLEVIEKTMSESERVKIVELMALTGEQMNEYVDRNVPEEKAEFVKNTLSKDAILSGSENPSYYAALCGVIGREDGSTINRSTYTQTLAEVLQVKLERRPLHPLHVLYLRLTCN